MQLHQANIIIEQNREIIALLKQIAGTGSPVAPVLPAITEVSSGSDDNEADLLFTVAKKKRWNKEETDFAYNLFRNLPHIEFLKNLKR